MKPLYCPLCQRDSRNWTGQRRVWVDGGWRLWRKHRPCGTAVVEPVLAAVG